MPASHQPSPFKPLSELPPVCPQNEHYGPLVNTAPFQAAGGVWRQMGNCPVCLSTIHTSQISRVLEDAA